MHLAFGPQTPSTTSCAFPATPLGRCALNSSSKRRLPSARPASVRRSRRRPPCGVQKLGRRGARSRYARRMLLSAGYAIVCALLDLLLVRTPSARALAVELLTLRHEVRVLRRQVKRTHWQAPDRLLIAALSRCVPRAGWGRFPVRPETLLHWHRELVRRKWAAFGRRRGPGRPPIAPELRALILRLARENPTWGYQRIRGELLKLGHAVAATTVQTVLRRHRVPPAPRRGGLAWPVLLRAHAAGLLACDFLCVETVRLQTLYVLFFLEVQTRRVVVAGCTAHPTATWVTQQARHVVWDLVAAGRRPTVLVRDRDAKFAPAFDAVFAAEGVRVLPTPVRAPRANAFAERWVGTVRRECLDWLLIFDARHLQQVLRGYAEHYNRARPHRGRGLHPPLGPPPPISTAPDRSAVVIAWVACSTSMSASLPERLGFCTPQGCGSRRRAGRRVKLSPIQEIVLSVSLPGAYDAGTGARPAKRKVGHPRRRTGTGRGTTAHESDG